MPSLGADMKEAILFEWYVKPGDYVNDRIKSINTSFHSMS